MNFDFVTGLVAADLMEEGAFCHFRNPATDEPLYLPGALDTATGKLDESKAVGAYVRSISSVAFTEHEKRVTRRNYSVTKKAKSQAQKDELLFAQVERQLPDQFAVLVTRFQNTSVSNPGVWAPTDDEKRAIAADPHNRAIVTQITDFAAEDSNYPGAAAGNVAADA